MIQMSRRHTNRNAGDMVIALCDSVRCKKTVVRKMATWHVASPTMAAIRMFTGTTYPTAGLGNDRWS